MEQKLSEPLFKTNKPLFYQIFILIFSLIGIALIVKDLYLALTGKPDWMESLIGLAITVAFYGLYKLSIKYTCYITFYENFFEIIQEGNSYKYKWDDILKFTYPLAIDDPTFYSFYIRGKKHRSIFFPKGMAFSLMGSIDKYPPVIDFIKSKLN